MATIALGNEILAYIEGWPYIKGLICIRMHIWDLAKSMAFIEGWPHLRGGLYEGFHCIIAGPIGNTEGGMIIIEF